MIPEVIIGACATSAVWHTWQGNGTCGARVAGVSAGEFEAQLYHAAHLEHYPPADAIMLAVAVS
jgi:hypothetical protein